MGALVDGGSPTTGATFAYRAAAGIGEVGRTTVTLAAATVRPTTTGPRHAAF